MSKIKNVRRKMSTFSINLISSNYNKIFGLLKYYFIFLDNDHLRIIVVI